MRILGGSWQHVEIVGECCNRRKNEGSGDWDILDSSDRNVEGVTVDVVCGHGHRAHVMPVTTGTCKQCTSLIRGEGEEASKSVM